MPFKPCAVSDTDCLRPTRILKSDVFRFAALFAFLFLAFTGILLGTVLWIVQETQRAALMSANDADIATVANGFLDEGIPEAVEVVKATEMLQGEVCGPADSMRKMSAHAEVNALLERIKGFWAQLPRTRPDSKSRKALVDKIHVESAAYLKIADAARGVDRKADARADTPLG